MHLRSENRIYAAKRASSVPIIQYAYDEGGYVTDLNLTSDDLREKCEL